ncbi:MAG: heme exporter protein CcmD [Alphaproteobacteria bacterium]
MDGLGDFLRMGGYAVYVWASYGVTAAVLIGLAVSTLRSLRAHERTAAILERDLPRGRRRRPARVSTAPAAPDAGHGS